jgi:hypothetical protein
MNPHYLWMTEGLELLTLFVIGPALGIVIAYRAWREKRHNHDSRRYGTRCIALGLAALLLFGFAKWLNADVRTAQYFLQLVSFLLSILSFSACTGYFFSVLLDLWEWQKTTRLQQ